jgi:DNA invertase Pin-like site-specific DNA recombinase
MCLEEKVSRIASSLYGYTCTLSSGPSSASQQAAIENYFPRLQPEGFAYSGCFSDPPESSRVRLDKRKGVAELDRHLIPGDQVVIANTPAVWSGPKDFVRIMEDWIKRGVGVHLLDIGMDSRTELGTTIMNCLAKCVEAFHVILPSERAKVSVAKKRQSRKALNGNPPLGFMLVGRKNYRRPVPDLRERRVMARILAWHEKGHSIDWIYFSLIRDRVRTRSGREWGRTRIWKALGAEMRLQNGKQGQPF